MCSPACCTCIELAVSNAGIPNMCQQMSTLNDRCMCIYIYLWVFLKCSINTIIKLKASNAGTSVDATILCVSLAFKYNH